MRSLSNLSLRGFAVYARATNAGIVMSCLYSVEHCPELLTIRICFN
jgi:hypothetical protein